MRVQLIVSSVFMCALFVTGCAAGPAAVTKKTKTIAAEKTGLSGRVLAAGDCGLFVWTADTERKFILFAQSQKMSAVYDTPDGEQILKITSQDGRPTQSQFPIQSYDDGVLRLALSGAQTITDGTRYKSGTLTMTSDEGWEKVSPVLGLSACQARD